MTNNVLTFYDSLAEVYHLIFEDWQKTIKHQAAILGPLLESRLGKQRFSILDCACGIGTQAIGFATRGHRVIASDLSPAAITRAKREASARKLEIAFCVSDVTSLKEVQETDIDVVFAFDNALPHLTADQLRCAIAAMRTKLRSGGLFAASIRDYDKLLLERPTVQQPAFYGVPGRRRIVHQVWDWIDHERYTVHLYITEEKHGACKNHHFVSEYRCLLRDELTSVLTDAGFEAIEWLMPEQSGYYQPIVLAKVP